VGIPLAEQALWFTQDNSAATSSSGIETPDYPQAAPATPLLCLSYVDRDESAQLGPNSGQAVKKTKKQRWSRLFGRK
jgi:hypothetical protein